MASALADATLRRLVLKGFAAGALMGACLEVFMVATGFYGVATRKEAEHRAEHRAELAARRRRVDVLRPGAADEER